MVTRKDLDDAIEELHRFSRDLCEQLCDDNADCIRKCRGQSLIEIGNAIKGVDPAVTTPDALSETIASLKRKLRSSKRLFR